MIRLHTAALLVAIAGCACALELPYREDFEGSRGELAAVGWRLPKTVSLVPGGPAEGKQCLKLSTPDASQRYAELFVPVQTGKFYRAQVQIKCENVDSHVDGSQNRGAVIFCEWTTHDKKWRGGGSFPNGLHGTHDWSLRTVDYTRETPEDVGYIRLLLGVEGMGTAWFDDLVVEEITGWDGVTAEAPEEGALVETNRPLLKWSVSESKLTEGMVSVSQSPEFPAQATIQFQGAVNRARPPTGLAPGKWFWRVQATRGNGKLPPGPTSTFVVPENAVLWPPDILPAWQWDGAPRPTLEARVSPEGVAKEVTATIAGRPAEIVSHEGELVRLRPTEDLEPGIHDVTITVLGRGDLKASHTSIFCSKRPGTRVEIRDDEVLLVDGEPFFPIGTYRDPSDRMDEFDGIMEAGFNVTHSYGFEDKSNRTVAQAREYLRACHDHGLKVFMGFRRDRIRAFDMGWIERWAAELMDEPALLTWYLLDEPAGHGVTIDLMDRMNQRVKAIDPFHPTSIVFCQVPAFKSYGHTCDILWNDPYPLPSRPLTMVDDWARLGMEACRPGQPYWCVLQGHDIRYWRQGYEKTLAELGPVALPSPQQTRCMAHIALSRGAKGIIWYWGPSSIYNMVKDAPVVWRGIVDTVQELKGLTPWLVARTSDEDAVDVPDPLRAWSRVAEGKRVLSIVNMAPDPVEESIRLGQFGVAQIGLRGSGETVALEEGTLATSFEPYEVKVFEWAVQ